MLMVLSNQEQLELAQSLLPEKHGIQMQIGGLSEALTHTTLTLACSGTVTRECGYHGVPTIVFYRLAWLTYWIAKRIIKVKYIAMPNLLLGRLVYPELIQSDATPQRIADKALQFLEHPRIRQQSRHSLERLMDAMGEPGAFDRAARTVIEYLPDEKHLP
jgi:lipid-A-disaccharide synthase